MSESPYTPPRADVADAGDDVGLPSAIERKIRNGWLAGIFSTILTAAFALLATFGASIGGINAYAFIDTVILAALTFGVYKQSRVCAVFMLVFFVVNKIVMWMDSPTIAGLPLALVFFWFYLQAMIGTFQASRFRRESRAAG